MNADDRLICAAPDLLAALESAPERPILAVSNETAQQAFARLANWIAEEYETWRDGPRAAALAKVKS